MLDHCTNDSFYTTNRKKTPRTHIGLPNGVCSGERPLLETIIGVIDANGCSVVDISRHKIILFHWQPVVLPMITAGINSYMMWAAVRCDVARTKMRYWPRRSPHKQL